MFNAAPALQVGAVLNLHEDVTKPMPKITNKRIFGVNDYATLCQ